MCGAAQQRFAEGRNLGRIALALRRHALQNAREQQRRRDVARLAQRAGGEEVAEEQRERCAYCVPAVGCGKEDEEEAQQQDAAVAGPPAALPPAPTHTLSGPVSVKRYGNVSRMNVASVHTC